MSKKDTWTKIGVVAMSSWLASCALIALSVAGMAFGHLMEDEIITKMAKDGLTVTAILFFLAIAMTSVSLAVTLWKEEGRR